MQNLTQPTLLLKPFAESGDKNTLPVTNTDASNPQLADLTNGFPQITSESPDDGGLPPERKDFNGLGYLTTTYDFFYQAGGTFTFNATISSAIGGYPKNARLWYTDSNGATTILRSTKNNNTDNFITTPSYIGTSWVPEIPALGWNNAWTGNNTFSGSVSLGALATATSPAASDSSTKVATTEWVAGHRTTTQPSTTSTASVNAPDIVVENYYDSTNRRWYIKFSSGFIIQGGTCNPTQSSFNDNNQFTVTFVKPFTTTTYTILKNIQHADSSSTYHRELCFTDRTTTTAKTYGTGAYTAYIAFGW